MKKDNFSINRLVKRIGMYTIILTVFGYFYGVVMAADSLVTIVQRVESNVASVARLLVLISYVAGVGFAMAGVLQFKAHKDNPTQVPLSKPIAYVCVGAFLLFLPKLMDTAGKTVFGVDTANAPGGSTDISQITAADK